MLSRVVIRRWGSMIAKREGMNGKKRSSFDIKVSLKL
jgi:hypothetical protein